MPELPEVETTRKGITPHILGRTLAAVVIRNASLRWPVSAELPQILTGHIPLATARRGKYLLVQFGHGTAIWHLGMSGSLRLVNRDTAPEKHDHIDWVLDSGLVLRFHDPRRFGALLWTDQPVAEHSLLAHLGPEPLSREFDGHYLYQRSRGRKLAIKPWLMDARVVVGVGNIYANEALFASGIHPLRAAGSLSLPRCVRLAEQVKYILDYAIRRGGTTLRDFVGGDGKPGYFAQELKVYGRGGEPCALCGKSLTEKYLAQRSTVYCTHCQS